LDSAAATTVVSTAAVSWNFVSGAKSGTPGTTGTVANWSAQTFTDSNTAASGTAAVYTAFAFQRPSLVATNASVTTTDAATIYIANAPLASTNETITNAYAIWVDAGTVRFDGDIDHNGTNIGFYGTTPAAQSATYTRNATIVVDRTLLASASATTINNNNVLAALIADLKNIGILG